MASGFNYIRDTEKVSVTLGGEATIVNKIKLPFGFETPFPPKIPVIDVGIYYDTVDNPIEIPSPFPLHYEDFESNGYDATFNGLNYSVIFTPINEDGTEIGMVIVGK